MSQEFAPPLVTTQRDGHVLLIGVNRADKRNAFNLAVIDQFAAAYEMFADDADLRAAVVFGHGDHFSAGLDLAEVGPAVAEKGPGRWEVAGDTTHSACGPLRCPNLS